MRHFKLTHKTSGEVSFAMAEDNQTQPPGIDAAKWTIEEIPNEPTELDSIKGPLRTTAKADQRITELLEQHACEISSDDVPTLRRQIAIMMLWTEIQRLKLAQATNNIPADLTERRKQYPTLMALVALSGSTLQQVATAAENRLWDRVRRLALWEAQLMLANDAVRSAATVDEKVAAMVAVPWHE